METFKGVIDDRIEVVLKEFQTVVSFGYLILIGLGMIFEGIHYSQFGINIFRYSGILDFLLVPFRRPVVLLILIVNSLIIWGTFKLDEYVKKRFPKLHNKANFNIPEKGNYLKVRFWGLVLFYIFGTIIYGYQSSNYFKSDIFKSPIDTRIEYDTRSISFIEGKMIGKNDLNIFLLDSLNHTQIIPSNSGIIKIIPIKRGSTK